MDENANARRRPYDGRLRAHPYQLVFFAFSIRATPASGATTLVWPSSQRTRRRGGSAAMTSSTTPLRGGCATRSDSTTIRSPACAFIAPPPRPDSTRATIGVKPTALARFVPAALPVGAVLVFASFPGSCPRRRPQSRHRFATPRAPPRDASHGACEANGPLARRGDGTDS